MKKSLSVILKTIGVLLLTMAGLLGWAAVKALIERLGHGAGLMFADVEFYFLLFLIFLIFGIFCFWIEKKLSGPKSEQDNTG